MISDIVFCILDSSPPPLSESRRFIGSSNIVLVPEQKAPHSVSGAKKICFSPWKVESLSLNKVKRASGSLRKSPMVPPVAGWSSPRSSPGDTMHDGVLVLVLPVFPGQ